MNLDSKVLVGTFLKTSFVSQKTLKSVIETFDYSNKIFIFDINDDDHKRLITFNIEKKDLGDKFIEFKTQNKNTLRLHRRKDRNIFYTINTIKKLIKEQNGNEDINFHIDWNVYNNCCLVLDKDENIKIIKTKLVKVIDYKKTEK